MPLLGALYFRQLNSSNLSHLNAETRLSCGHRRLWPSALVLHMPLETPTPIGFTTTAWISLVGLLAEMVGYGFPSFSMTMKGDCRLWVGDVGGFRR